jgi:copper chaperone CopZ
MTPKEILKNYLIKQFNKELLRLEKETAKDRYTKNTISDIVMDGELNRIKGMLMNVYGLKNSEYSVMLWELLGTNDYSIDILKYVSNDISYGEILKELDAGLINNIKFNRLKDILE